MTGLPLSWERLKIHTPETIIALCPPHHIHPYGMLITNSAVTLRPTQLNSNSPRTPSKSSTKNTTTPIPPQKCSRTWDVS